MHYKKLTVAIQLYLAKKRRARAILGMKNLKKIQQCSMLLNTDGLNEPSDVFLHKSKKGGKK